jgi:hypothetical protein
MTKEQTQESRKPVRMVFTQSEWEKVDYLLNHYKMDRPHDLIKFIVTDTWQGVKENKMRYGDPDREKTVSPRAQREKEKAEDEAYIKEMEEKFLAMNPDEMTQFLKDIGFIMPDYIHEKHDMPLGNGWIKNYVAYREGTKDIYFYVEVYYPDEIVNKDAGDHPTQQLGEVYSLPELLDQLRKLKYNRDKNKAPISA